MGGSYLYATASHIVGSNISPESFVAYLDQLLEEAGQPTDPIERMLIEQIAMAHHNIGRLYVRAASAETLDQVNVYNAAAARLLAEFRRAAIALKTYREPTPRKNFMLVKQQNVAQHQQIALVDGKSADKDQLPAESEASGKCQNGELGSEGVVEHASQKNVVSEPQPCRCREKEPVEAKRLE